MRFLPAGRAAVRAVQHDLDSGRGHHRSTGGPGLLGGPADRSVFQVLRSLADVILVGAGTARSEDYGPVTLDDQLRAQRAARGQSSVPPIAVVTGSGNLDWSAPFFTEAEARPIVVTAITSDVGARRRAETVADVLVAGRTAWTRPRPCSSCEGRVIGRCSSRVAPD